MPPVAGFPGPSLVKNACHATVRTSRLTTAPGSGRGPAAVNGRRLPAGVSGLRLGVLGVVGRGVVSASSRSAGRNPPPSGDALTSAAAFPRLSLRLDGCWCWCWCCC